MGVIRGVPRNSKVVNGVVSGSGGTACQQVSARTFSSYSICMENVVCFRGMYTLLALLDGNKQTGELCLRNMGCSVYVRNLLHIIKDYIHY